MLHLLQNDTLTITVSERGAELQSILDCDGTEYLWQGDPAYWADRAINLFPYVARLTDGAYQMDGTLYHLPIHGFAPTSMFSLSAKTEDSLTFVLTDSEETYRQYPRHFAFYICYRLQGKTLHITYKVENRDIRVMYFGLGGHPGFRLPMADGIAFSDYELQFSNPCHPRRVGFTDACFLDGNTSDFPLQNHQILPLCHSLFDNDAIVLSNMDREVTLRTAKDSRKITVCFPQMPYLGLWHAPKTEAPYLCIEPWCSLPSKQDQITEFETQPDLIRLDPGCAYQNEWSISI